MTSIEWLVDHLKDYGFDLSLHQFEIEQAKEMHKQEIIETYRFALSDEYVIGSEKYYQETFVSKGSDEVELPKQDVDKFEKFLDNEIAFGLSPKDTIERIKWYYQKYFKNQKNKMKIGTSSLMNRHLVDFSNENSDRIKSASTQFLQQQTYTLEQMRMAFDYGKSLEPFDSFEEFINSLTT